MTRNFSKRLDIIFRNPRFWITLALIVLITIPQYLERQLYLLFLPDYLTSVGFIHHALESLFYLVPICFAGLSFGWRGSFITSIIALALMIPGDSCLSDHQVVTFLETSVVFVIGSVIAVTLRSLHKERNQNIQMKNTHNKLKDSEEKYHQLFENAPDAMLVHDGEGNIINANRACSDITGYALEDLCKLKLPELLTDESWLIAEAVEHLILSGDSSDWTTEVKLVKKGKNEADVQFSVNLIRKRDKSVVFQCMIRDISEQKRIQENLHYYLQQATRAQEEERKRIALELHDGAIQELVVLYRQLDILATKGQELSSDNNLLLKDLRQQTKNIMQSLRNLSQDLRPATLDRLGLLPALGFLASEMSKDSSISVKVNVLGSERRLREEEELMLFRITQEALRNVWRHSRASKAEITIEFSQQKIRVMILDDGKGFYVPENINILSKNGKLGLVGMQERAQLINGHLQIQSEPGKGTMVAVEALV